MDNEVCRVISHYGSVFTVERALYGTAKADHTNNTAIRLPFFNAYNNYNRYSVAQTNKNGKFKCRNFFGYGRTADAISDGKNIYIIGIMEHIEPCGNHSGDSNACLPPFNLGDLVLQQIKDHTEKIAKALNTVGLINIQFAIVDDMVYIIEANPRASRTVPFISKAYKEPYVNYATKVMLGEKKHKDFKFNPTYSGYAIKEPVFSFNKFPNVNKQLGPEMKSTGESILFIDNLQDDKFHDLYSRRKMYLSK